MRSLRAVRLLLLLPAALAASEAQAPAPARRASAAAAPAPAAAPGPALVPAPAAAAAAAPAPAPPGAGALYYKLEGGEVGGKGWPQDFLKYSVLVANPGFKPSVLQRIRDDLPGARVVAYTCMSWAYVSQPCTNCTGAGCSGCPGGRCVDRNDAAGKPYWNASWNVRNLHDGRPICPFGGLHHKVVPVAAWIPQKESVEAMVRFHAEVTVQGYDGLYLDDYMSSFYGPWQTYIELISAHPDRMEHCSHAPVHGTTARPSGCESYFATGSSGHNSSLAALQAQYAAWRPYYTAKLRQALDVWGPKLLIANAPAPSVADPALNGITIEFEHCAGDQSPHTDALAAGADAQSLNDVCRETLLGQRAQTDLAGLEPVFGLWLTHSEVLPAPTQCAELRAVQAALPWVREGDDITDCTRETGPASCVRCNQSATDISTPAPTCGERGRPPVRNLSRWSELRRCCRVQT